MIWLIWPWYTNILCLCKKRDKIFSFVKNASKKLNGVVCLWGTQLGAPEHKTFESFDLSVCSFVFFLLFFVFFCFLFVCLFFFVDHSWVHLNIKHLRALICHPIFLFLFMFMFLFVYAYVFCFCLCLCL